MKSFAKIYGWSDGSSVILWVDPDAYRPVLFSVMIDGKSVLLQPLANQPFLRGRALLLAGPEISPFIENSFRKKIFGFAADLGVETRPISSSTGIFVSDDSHRKSVIDYPLFVSDEAWNRRYEIGRSLSRSSWDMQVKGPFLGLVDDLQICQRVYLGRSSWQATWRRDPNLMIKRTSERESLEMAVDDVIQQELMLPESYRSLWEASNIERGIWLCPSADEIELFRMLGEELPFFWGEDQLEAWLSERESP